MKNLNFLRWMMGAALLLSLGLTACGKKNQNNLVSSGYVSAFSDTCSTGAPAIGMIYNDGTMNFQTQVAAYVSSWMDPQSLGTVDGNPGSSQTGVDFKGKLRFDAANQIIIPSSGLEITITDSFTAQGQPPIATAVYNSHAISGQLNPSTRQFDVRFQDQYGQVQIIGQYDNSIAQGFVKFQNTRAVGNFGPQSGVLGAFRISKCGLLDP